MKILVTAGGTSEKIDDVRRITNSSTGKLGSLIAEEFLQLPNVELTYVCGENAVIPTESNRLSTHKITSVNSLKTKLEQLFSLNNYDAVIHSMAVSDYTVRHVANADSINEPLNSGKIGSDIETLAIILEKTPKIIGMIKDLQPETVLVGFKLLSGVDDGKLVQVAHDLLVKNRCDFVLANDIQRITDDKHFGILVGGETPYPSFSNKIGIAQGIVKAVTAKMIRTTDLKIGFVGAGRIGCALGRYFIDRGINVTGYFSRTRQNAQNAAEFTKTQCYGGLEKLVETSDVLMLSVTDAAIGEVWKTLKQFNIKGKTVCHCSGALTSDIFDGITELGAVGCSLHPFCAVGTKETVIPSETCFTYEGQDCEFRRTLQKTNISLHYIEEKNKVKYHAAAVFLSNFLNSIAYTGGNILKECGLGEDFIQNVLNSIFLGQAGNIVRNGVIESLSGPVERNDALTVQKHLECLADEEKTLYTALSRRLIEVAGRKNNNDYTEMRKML